MIIAVAVPITKGMVSSANLSGTDATIAGVLVTLLLVGAVALVGSLAFFAMRGK
jgi:hypothetical protein